MGILIGTVRPDSIVGTARPAFSLGIAREASNDMGGVQVLRSSTAGVTVSPFCSALAARSTEQPDTTDVISNGRPFGDSSPGNECLFGLALRR
jgi:hypothetical protein